jgi:hypothetical protein
MTDHQIAQKILNTLEKQRFANWYSLGRFDDYIVVAHPEGDPQHVSRDDVLNDIIDLFGLDN